MTLFIFVFYLLKDESPFSSSISLNLLLAFGSLAGTTGASTGSPPLRSTSKILVAMPFGLLQFFKVRQMLLVSPSLNRLSSSLILLPGVLAMISLASQKMAARIFVSMVQQIVYCLMIQGMSQLLTVKCLATIPRSVYQLLKLRTVFPYSYLNLKVAMVGVSSCFAKILVGTSLASC